MLIVHLFVSYAHVNLCHFFSSSCCRSWLRLLLVALPGHFCLPFFIQFTDGLLNLKGNEDVACDNFSMAFVSLFR